MIHEEIDESRWHDDGGRIHEEKSMHEAIEGVNLTAKPSGTGCVECLASGKGWWLHLRRCAECGHIGCCNDSPMKHATAHFHETKHPIIQSFEPGEDWFFDFTHPNDVQPVPASVHLAAPTQHPAKQAVPFTVPAIKHRKVA